MTIQANLGKIWALTGQVTDPGDTKYALGWQAEIPTFQNFNFVLQNYDKNFLAIAEKGVFDWQANINYEVGSKVNVVGVRYTCLTNNINQDPTTDTLGNYWVLGETWGTGVVNKGGLVVYDVVPKVTNKWSGNDLTLNSIDTPVLAFSNRQWNSNWLLSNVEGNLAVVQTSNTYNPDGRDLRPAYNPTSFLLFHEGHPPTQSEIANTIPANPYDGVLYGRRDGNWVKVSTTTTAEHPPHPVQGDGAGWYNLQDGYLYIDINDGDSSQWVPAAPAPTLDTNYLALDGSNSMFGDLGIYKANPYIRLGTSDGPFASSNLIFGLDGADDVVLSTYRGGSSISKLNIKSDGNISNEFYETSATLVPTVPQVDADLVNKKYADGTSTQAENGFTVLPNGLMMVWGKLTCVGDGNQAQTFHTPFPNNCFNVQATYEAIAGNGAGSVAVRDFTKTGFVSDRVDSNLDGFFYFYAIGN